LVTDRKRVFGAAHIALLLADIGPQLVALDPAHAEPDHHAVMQLGSAAPDTDWHDFRAKLDKLHPRYGKPTQLAFEYAAEEQDDDGKGL
jgi:hypothetical protein